MASIPQKTGSGRPWLCPLVLLLMALAALGVQAEEISDPIEPANRVFFRVNDTLDNYLMEPVARTYHNYTPSWMQNGLSNFFSNLGIPYTLANQLLQGKPDEGFADLGRFMINTTVGLGGFIDMASPLGLPLQEEDLGQTFGVWGFGPGPYLVVPLLGPSSVRDLPGQVVPLVATPYAGFLGSGSRALMSGGALVSKRADALDKTDTVDDMALDPYVFVREGYAQRRRHLVHDGQPPAQDWGDFLDE